jgi:glycosyltransferase involved in cell wall biosynthesis
MRFVIVTSEFNFYAGYERLSLELADGLIKNGHEVDLVSVYSRNYNSNITDFSKIINIGVQNIYFLGVEIHSNLYDYVKSILIMRKILITGKYDVIEASGFSSSFIIALSMIGLNIKTYIGIHRVYQLNEHNSLKYIIWKKILKQSSSIEYYAISKAVSFSWYKYQKSKSNRIHLLYNSINDDYFFNPDILIVKTEFKRRILFVGRLMKSKGIEILYLALKDLLVEYNLELFIVGKDDDSENSDDFELVQNIKNDILDSNLTNHIKFLGHRNDVKNLMLSSDILVHPPLSEGFGLVIAEALACGMQIIATNVGGIPEVLSDTHGILIPPNNICELKKALLSLLNQNDKELESSREKNKQKAFHFTQAERTYNFLKIIHGK